MSHIKLAIVGTREFNNYLDFKAMIIGYLVNNNISISDIYCIVSGGARGVDSLAEKLAKDIGTPIKIFPAEWDKHGKYAGFLRNEEIWGYATQGIAIWDGQSKGTKHSIETAVKFKKPITIIRYDLENDLIVDIP